MLEFDAAGKHNLDFVEADAKTMRKLLAVPSGPLVQGRCVLIDGMLFFGPNSAKTLLIWRCVVWFLRLARRFSWENSQTICAPFQSLP